MAALCFFQSDCSSVLENPCNFENNLKKEVHSSFRYILLNLGKMDVMERKIIFHRLAV